MKRTFRVTVVVDGTAALVAAGAPALEATGGRSDELSALGILTPASSGVRGIPGVRVTGSSVSADDRRDR